jgi:hypothetical protein
LRLPEVRRVPLDLAREPLDFDFGFGFDLDFDEAELLERVELPALERDVVLRFALVFPPPDRPFADVLPPLDRFLVAGLPPDRLFATVPARERDFDAVPPLERVFAGLPPLEREDPEPEPPLGAVTG